METYASTVHVTQYPPQLKHKIIFETFENLKQGEAMLIVNDHDPRPLRFQFESMHGGSYMWEYVEQGPEIYRVKIGKV